MPHKITDLYAYVATEPDGTEGIPAQQLGRMMSPLIAADVDRLKSIQAMAQHIVDETGQPLKLVRFTTRTDLGTIQPRTKKAGE